MNTTYTICMCAITCNVNIHLHFMGMIIAHLGLVLAKQKLFNTENACGKYMTCFIAATIRIVYLHSMIIKMVIIPRDCSNIILYYII